MSNGEIFEQIYTKHFTIVYEKIKEILYSKIIDDITSCTNDTFVKAWKKIDTLKNHENIIGWLISTAKNTAMDFNTKYSIRRNHEINSDIIESIPNEEDFTEEIFSEFEAEKTLSCLSPKERDLYDYIYVVGYNNAEIGKILGITPNAVVKRNIKLIKKLKIIYKAKNNF